MLWNSCTGIIFLQLVLTCRNCRFGKHLSSDKNFVTLDVPFSSCKHYTHTNS